MSVPSKSKESRPLEPEKTLLMVSSEAVEVCITIDSRNPAELEFTNIGRHTAPTKRLYREWWRERPFEATATARYLYGYGVWCQILLCLTEKDKDGADLRDRYTSKRPVSLLEMGLFFAAAPKGTGKVERQHRHCHN